MILGITGGTGCGKTTLLNAVEALGGITLDCDEIYHDLLARDDRLQSALREAFPQAFPHGTLDRKKLGGIVFSNPDALRKLNEITHGAVRREVLACLRNAPALAAIDAIALFEGGLSPLCDATIAVTAPREERIRRLMVRDGITREYAAARIDAQHPDSWFRERCDYCLENRGDKSSFQKECTTLLMRILSQETGGNQNEY